MAAYHETRGQRRTREGWVTAVRPSHSFHRKPEVQQRKKEGVCERRSSAARRWRRWQRNEEIRPWRSREATVLAYAWTRLDNRRSHDRGKRDGDQPRYLQVFCNGFITKHRVAIPSALRMLSLERESKREIVRDYLSNVHATLIRIVRRR